METVYPHYALYDAGQDALVAQAPTAAAMRDALRRHLADEPNSAPYLLLRIHLAGSGPISLDGTKLLAWARNEEGE